MRTLPSRYSDSSFWKKLGRCALRAGKAVVRKALTLYYCLGDPDTPAWARTVIVGALAYFIMPVDAIPDFLPGGFVDDLATLAGAYFTVEAHIKEEHVEKARKAMKRWFGR